VGYTTSFHGHFSLDKPLAAEHKVYLEAFSDTRRMKRNSAKTEKMKDKRRKDAALPIGIDGGFYVGDQEDFGQSKTSDVLDYNSPPAGQPGLWCQWVPTEDGMGMEWNQSEKFYHYTEWLTYLIDNFLKPWGYVVNGNVSWTGEDSDDLGRIWVKNNVVKAVKTQLLNDEPDWGDSIPEPLDEVDVAPSPIEDVIADALMLKGDEDD
jgi:hypothetical protein